MAYGFGRRRSPLDALLSPLMYGRGLPFGGGGGQQIFQAMFVLNLLQEVAALRWRPPLTMALMAVNTASFFATGRVLPVLGPWTISSCGFDAQRASLLLRVLTVAAQGGSRRLRWGASRGAVVVVLASRELFRRVLVSQFMHVDTMHLYYNMTSMLWKGLQLEPELGRAGLGRLVAFSLATGPLFALSVSAAMARLGWGHSMRTTTVGFSGVLFTLKVVANASASRSTVLPFIGVVVPSRWATWIELLLIRVLVPGSSFVGHLGGILSGLTYLALQRALPGSTSGAGQHGNGSWQQRRPTRAGRGAGWQGGAAAAAATQSVTRAFHQMARQCEAAVGWCVLRLRQLLNPSPRRPPRFHGSGTTGRARTSAEPMDVD